MNLSEIVGQRGMKLDRAAVGPDLSSRIRGRADVEHLRRLVAGTGTYADAGNAILWTAEELKNICYEAWGSTGPTWSAKNTPHLRAASDTLKLRIALESLLEEGRA